MITKKQFRWILCVYCIVVAGTIVADVLTESMVPEAVRELESTFAGRSLPFLLMFIAIGVAMLAGGLTGLIGMFCYCGPSRYIFLIAVMSKILLSPLIAPWLVHTAWEAIFGELELLLDGAILVLCLVGPAKHLFERKIE